MSLIASSHEQTHAELTEDDLRSLIQRIEQHDLAKIPLSPTDLDRLHFLSNNFDEAHPRALNWAFDTAHRCLQH
ncbi:MAG: hypothetical protein DI628_05360 [Blastochloris viridis]|uniref:Uncharacterized protein n=1 Tax=Blastochloris viridis TaxID=1079 RepID=A0A6N4RED1_BLAVI|nr:MAG: hypothetical protein DI628_05360 [Blastochloris viridis]